MHMINLFLACIWALLGIGLLAADYFMPDAGSPRVFGTDLSWGWVALLLAFYNLVRWYGRWSIWKSENARKDRERRTEYARRDREFRESGRQRDSNFIFDESPDAGEN
jgi:hypothetical protein